MFWSIPSTYTHYLIALYQERLRWHIFFMWETADDSLNLPI